VGSGRPGFILAGLAQGAGADEDKRFYDYSGVDWQAVSSGGQPGGTRARRASTLNTMELARTDLRLPEAGAVSGAIGIVFNSAARQNRQGGERLCACAVCAKPGQQRPKEGTGAPAALHAVPTAVLLK
jgi:hypothetical protein